MLKETLLEEVLWKTDDENRDLLLRQIELTRQEKVVSIRNVHDLVWLAITGRVLRTRELAQVLRVDEIDVISLYHGTSLDSPNKRLPLAAVLVSRLHKEVTQQIENDSCRPPE